MIKFGYENLGTLLLLPQNSRDVPPQIVAGYPLTLACAVYGLSCLFRLIRQELRVSKQPTLHAFV